MTSNFDFLKPRFPAIYQHAVHAESLIRSAPRAACFYTRFTLEQAVHWLYQNDPYLQLPPKDKPSLADLIYEQTFKENLAPGLLGQIRNIHKLGNLAVHDASPTSSSDALYVVESLFQFLYWLCRYYAADGRNLGDIKFDRDRIVQPAASAQSDLSRQKLQAIQAQMSKTDDMRRIAEERANQTAAELAELKAQLDALKQANAVVPDPHQYTINEAETRRVYIDTLLREAGWPIHQDGWREVKVSGMPSNSGSGYVDYVLWGDDGKPLALVEAKRTSKDASSGKHQAKLYADCLEAQFGQRPVIFYSNGFETWMWDDVTYPPRLIHGFLKKDELERLHFRRHHRKRLHLVQPNPDIINRSYQQEAIQRLAKTFDQRNGRKGLLVMATGTGKTRTAIALVDVLMRANWAKRVLFLADRTALLTQAKRAFTKHLPTAIAVDLTSSTDVDGANIVLSTYPTMLNRLEKMNDSGRLFGSGHFDLVIVDEAHRSIYQKYRVLFDYFDALLVGLTATPRDEVHRDTYQIFDLEAGNPTFAYELTDAIADGHLVPPKGINVPFKFLRQGIKYADLSPAEQEEYEVKFRDDETGTIPDQVNAAALNRWLFNQNTIDQALEILMTQGISVNGGDQLGKTLIFARNHDHAELIVQRFDANYPHLKGCFAQVIDSHDSYAQSLLDNFSQPHKQPTIAVSVDMLDTGVDVPEVVNLVFFKPVYSQVKFNQMIGRGTRLCPDLFAPGVDKQEFLIFDLCSNFEFFNQQVKEAEQKPADSLTARLVKARLRLSEQLKATAATNPNHQVLRETLLDDLHQHVATMELSNILVRRQLQTVEVFQTRDRWSTLTDQDQAAIADILAHLPNSRPAENELAKRFDLLCFKLQSERLEPSGQFEQLRDQVRDLLHQLETKRDIPMVKDQLPLIEDVQTEDWWTDVTAPMLENLRLRLRQLIRFIDRESQKMVYTNFKDELVGKVSEAAVPLHSPGFSPYQYRKKVEAYIRDNANHVAIAKLKRNAPLTEADLQALDDMLFNSDAIESRDRFEQVYQKDLNLKLFIRKLVGCDRSAAKQAFAQYLEGAHFSANQIRFVETIIDYLTQNGVMDPGLLYEPPFTNQHPEGLDGIFSDDAADQLINIVSSFNATVGEHFGAA